MTRRLLPTAAVLLFAASAFAAPAITVTCDDADGIVDVGQRVTWKVAAEPGVTKLRFTLKRGGRTEIASGEAGGSAFDVVGKLDEPGTLLLEVRGTDANGADTKALGGVAVDPTKIPLADARPADFDAFWEAKLAELAQVPINAQVTEVDPTTQPMPATTAPATLPADVAYYHVTLDNIRGTHVRGQLARPRSEGKYPALLVVQWAGVYGLQPKWVTDHASAGWLALNINAHDLPIDQPEAFYKAQNDGALKGYSGIGKTDREQSYFLRMYLGVARAIDYLKTRPDWDGRTIVVQGSSQGGLQAFVGAALRPDDVTAAIANVPAGADMLGIDVGRQPGWPGWVRWAGNAPIDQVRAAAQYYDIAHLAPRVKCPVLVSAGLLDETCSPSSVYAAANQLGGPKEIVAMPKHGHSGSHVALWQRAEAWRNAIKAGEPVPVAKN